MATGGRRLPAGRRRRWSRVSASCIKDPRLHPNLPPEAPAADATRTPGGPRPLGSISPGIAASPGGAAPVRSAARGCGPGGGGSGSGFGRRRDTMRPGSSAASAAGPRPTQSPPPPPALEPLGPRRLPTLGSGARLPQRLGHRLPDVAAQQAEQERRRPAHLRAAGPRAARAGRSPARSGASRAVGRRASLHVAWLRARRAPPPDWPRPRPARRRAPQPTAAPASARPGGFPRREPPPRRRRRRLNPFAPPPGEAPRPGAMVPSGGRAPIRPPASPPPWVHPALPPNSGGRGRDLGAHTALPFGSNYTRLSGPYPLTWLADGPPKALGSPRVI